MADIDVVLAKLEATLKCTADDIADIKKVLDGLPTRIALLEAAQAEQRRKQHDTTVAVYTTLGLVIAGILQTILQWMHH